MGGTPSRGCVPQGLESTVPAAGGGFATSSLMHEVMVGCKGAPRAQLALQGVVVGVPTSRGG